MSAYQRVLQEVVDEVVARKIVEMVRYPIWLSSYSPILLAKEVRILWPVAQKAIDRVRTSLDRVYQFGAVEVSEAESPHGRSRAIRFASDGDRIQTALTLEDASLLMKAYASRSSACVRLAMKVEKAGLGVCKSLREQRDADAAKQWRSMKQALEKLDRMLSQLSERDEKEKPS